MKQIFTLNLCAFFFSSIVYSQTITRDWIVLDAPINFVSGAINTADPIGPGDAGNGVTWDFSSVIADDTLAPFETQFVDPVETPFAADFMNANLAQTLIEDSLEGDFYSYYQLTDDQFSILGLGANVEESGSIKTVYSDPEVIMQFPFSFGNSFTDTWENTSTITSDIGEFMNTTRGEVEVTFDGTGTLITPAGSFDNVARIKTTSNDADTMEIQGILSITNTEREDYIWVKENFSGLASYTKSVINSETAIPGSPPISVGTFETTTFSWADAGITTNTRDFENGTLDVKFVSANPVLSDQVSFEITDENSGNLKYQIFNHAGVQILKNKVSTISGIQTIHIELPTSMVNGYYSVHFQAENGHQKVWPIILTR